jgi:hypothetical protein
VTSRRNASRSRVSGSARRAFETALISQRVTFVIPLFLDIALGVEPLEIGPQVGDLSCALLMPRVFKYRKFWRWVLKVSLKVSSFETMPDFLLASE